jgi:predicted permease
MPRRDGARDDGFASSPRDREKGAGQSPDPARIDGDVDDEVHFHIERKVEALVRAGMSREDARREALRRFGDVDRIKEQMTTMTRKREERRRKTEAWDALRLDVAYALRQLARSPGFTAVAILTLTLGIGATTAIFSVVDGILLRPLPFEKSEQLVAVWSDWTARGGPADEWPNFPNLWGLREQSTSLAGVGITAGSSGTLTGVDGPAEFIQGAAVNYDMFASVLRVEPEIGRGLAPEDDQPGTPRVILLSHGLWTRAFGADPGIVKRTITLNGNPFEVIGVMGESFRPPPVLQGDYWIPLKQDMTNFTCGIGGACLQSIARLADGATIESARAEAEQIAGRQTQQEPAENAGIKWTLRPLQEDLVANARVGLFVVLGAAGFVLLIACVNQASLLLARGTGRRAELAVRSAIGAGRGRIVTQLMVESMVLALLGGLTGIGAAYLLTDLLVTLAPAGTPRIDEVAVDARVLGFAALITMLSGLFFGIVPALRIAGRGLHNSLREGGRGDSRAAGVRIRQGLVVAQVGLALMLLTGSGLLLRTFQNLREVDLGFRPEGVLSFRVNLPAARYEPGEPILAFHRELEEKLGAIPGVESAALTTSLPLGGFNTDRGFTIQGRPVPPPDQSQTVWFQGVTPELMQTIGTSVVQGRGITAADVGDAPGVVVVNEAFAKRYFPSGDALGQHVNFADPAAPVWNEIVGVAQDVKHFGLRGERVPRCTSRSRSCARGPRSTWYARTSRWRA